MGVRDEALVAPEPMAAAPRKARDDGRGRKPLIELSRRRSTRQTDGKIVITCLRKIAEPFRDVQRERFRVLEYPVLHRSLDHRAQTLAWVVLSRMRAMAAA